jgi:hypothetical protein
MLNNQVDLVKLSLKEISSKNSKINSFQTNYNCFNSAFRSCYNKRIYLYYLKSEKKMKKVVSYENLIKLSKKMKLMKLFLLNDDQREMFRYCETPLKINDRKPIQDLDNNLKIENDNQVDSKMLKYLKVEVEKIL